MGRSPSGTPSCSPGYASPSPPPAQHDKVDTTTTTTLFGSSSGYASVFQRLPLANLFNDGRTFSLRPALIYDTRDNRLFPSSGIYLQVSTEWADAAVGSEINFLRHRFTGRFYYPLGGSTGQPGSGFVLKLNTELGYITSPSAQGVPIFQRFFLGGILDIRGYRLRTIGARLPLNQSLDVNAPPISNGANIGGNLEAYSNLELEFPIVDKVGIRGVVFYDMGNAWNTESQFCKTTPAPQFSHVSSAPASASAASRTCAPAPASESAGSPPWGRSVSSGASRCAPLAYEEHSVFEFTIGNFF